MFQLNAFKTLIICSLVAAMCVCTDLFYEKHQITFWVAGFIVTATHWILFVIADIYQQESKNEKKN